MASRYIKRGNPEKAIFLLEREISRHKADYQTYFYLAIAHKENEEFDKVLPNLNKSIEQNPDFFYSIINRGIYFDQKEKYNLALKDYNKAISIKPDSFKAFYLRGKLNHLNGLLKKGLLDYNKALKLKPKNMHVLLYKARLFYDKNEYKKAKTEYENILKLYPKKPKVFDEYAWVLIMSPDAKFKNPQKAFKLATEAVKIYPCGVSYDTIAAVYADFRDFPNAIKYQKKAIDWFKKNTIKDPALNAYLIKLDERLNSYKKGKEWKEPKGEHRKFTINPM